MPTRRKTWRTRGGTRTATQTRLGGELVQGLVTILRQLDVRDLESDRPESLQFRLDCLKKYVIPNLNPFQLLV